MGKGNNVCILDLSKFEDRFFKIYKDKKVINKNLKIAGVLFYIWVRGSYIPFHNDENFKAASSIYLNDFWDADDGGLFPHFLWPFIPRPRCFALAKPATTTARVTDLLNLIFPHQ